MPLFVKMELNRFGLIEARVTEQENVSGNPMNWSGVVATESTVSQVLRTLASRFAANRYVAEKEKRNA